MTKFEIWRDLILLALGAFGAGLSMFNYIDVRRRDRRALKVTLSSAIPVYEDVLGATYVRISVTNIGARAVNVVSLRLQLNDGSTLGFRDVDQMPGMPDSRFPITLADGEQASIYLMYNQVGRAVAKRADQNIYILPVAEDSTGKIYRGGRWLVDPAEWKSR